MCSCCSYCGYYRAAGAAIRVASSAVIGTTCGTAVKIAGGIGGAASKISGTFYRASYKAFCGGC